MLFSFWFGQLLPASGDMLVIYETKSKNMFPWHDPTPPSNRNSSPICQLVLSQGWTSPRYSNSGKETEIRTRPPTSMSAQPELSAMANCTLPRKGLAQ